MKINKNSCSLFLVMFFFIISCNKKKNENENENENENIEYYDNGEKYKKTEYLQDGSFKVYYFLKDGTKEAEGYSKGAIENLIVFYNTGEIYEKGQFVDEQRIGWHHFYHPDGRKMKDVFFVKGKVYQYRNFLKDGTVNLKESVLVKIELSSDTLNQNEEMSGTINYWNIKSQYQFVAVYLSNEINDDFSNMDELNKETFYFDHEEGYIPFTVKFKGKGRKFIRGYLLDAVSDSIDMYELNGIKVLFEKEVYVK